MTMPHLMNCSHQGEGWCLQCVAALEKELAEARNKIDNFDVNWEQQRLIYQQQLSIEQNGRDKTEIELGRWKRFHAELNSEVGVIRASFHSTLCDKQTQIDQLQHRIEQAEVKNAELRERLTELRDECDYQIIEGFPTIDRLLEETNRATKALSSTPDVGQWVRKEDTDAVEKNYNELLYAVCRKFNNETRHQTALRYIQEKESNALAGTEKSVMKSTGEYSAPQKEEEK